jgi:hypothetical protein
VKHRLRRIAVLAVFVMITLFFPLLAPPRHRIDDAHFRLIKGGMTEAEVEAIFGVPAGGYDWAVRNESARFNLLALHAAGMRDKLPPDQAGLADQLLLISALCGDESRLRVWYSRHGVFYVGLDHQGRVATTGAGWESVQIVPPWRKWWDKIVSKR